MLKKNLYRILIKIISFTLILILLFEAGSAQNLLANPGFEDVNICSEYHSPCAPEAWFYIMPTAIPVINAAIPPRFMGANCLWIPVQNVYAQNKMQQIIYTNLLCPLLQGKKYKISFYINTLDRPFCKIEMGLTKTEPGSKAFSNKDLATVLPVTPDMAIAQIKKTWQAIEIIYTAKGGERFFIIGNISKESFPFKENERMNDTGEIYYFIDDISIRSLDNIPFCAASEKVKSKMYARNFRHTDSAYINLSDTETMTRKDTIVIPAIFFKTNKSDLESAYKFVFNKIISEWKADKIDRIDIEGHTDDTGTLLQNMALSEYRAKKIEFYIINKIPALKQKIYTSGKAWYFPIVGNNNESERSQNRRVSIILTYRL